MWTADPVGHYILGQTIEPEYIVAQGFCRFQGSGEVWEEVSTCRALEEAIYYGEDGSVPWEGGKSVTNINGQVATMGVADGQRLKESSRQLMQRI